MSEASFDDKLT